MWKENLWRVSWFLGRKQKHVLVWVGSRFSEHFYKCWPLKFKLQSSNWWMAKRTPCLLNALEQANKMYSSVEDLVHGGTVPVSWSAWLVVLDVAGINWRHCHWSINETFFTLSVTCATSPFHTVCFQTEGPTVQILHEDFLEERPILHADFMGINLIPVLLRILFT
jgi:hypothetical protein